MAKIRLFRKAVIARLNVAQPELRVFTEPVPATDPSGKQILPPYLAISSHGSRSIDHFGDHNPANLHFTVRGAVVTHSGDDPLLVLWEQFQAVLNGAELTLEDGTVCVATVRYVTDYGDPKHRDIRYFIARVEATHP